MIKANQLKEIQIFSITSHTSYIISVRVLKLGISLGFDKKYFARKSLSFRNIFAILIRLNQKCLKFLRGSKFSQWNFDQPEV